MVGFQMMQILHQEKHTFAGAAKRRDS